MPSNILSSRNTKKKGESTKQIQELIIFNNGRGCAKVLSHVEVKQRARGLQRKLRSTAHQVGTCLQSFKKEGMFKFYQLHAAR